MLDINKISTSALDEEQWLANRIGKLTASDMGKLVSENSWNGTFSKGGLTYLNGKVYENQTGQPYKEKFHTKDTDYGNATEPEAIEYFCKVTGLKPMRNTERDNTQHLIVQDELSSCTPDILVYEPHLTEKTIFDSTGQFLKVIPVEIKCPPSDFFYTLYDCVTTEDLKKASKLYYWQVLTQMLFCDSLVSYFAVYRPATDTEEAKMKIIQFKKIKLIEDLKNLVLTIDAAKRYIKNQLKKAA